MRWLIQAWKRNHASATEGGRFLFFDVEVAAINPQAAKEMAAQMFSVPTILWDSGNPKPEICLRAFPLTVKCGKL